MIVKHLKELLDSIPDDAEIDVAESGEIIGIIHDLVDEDAFHILTREAPDAME